MLATYLRMSLIGTRRKRQKIFSFLWRTNVEVSSQRKRHQRGITKTRISKTQISDLSPRKLRPRVPQTPRIFFLFLIFNSTFLNICVYFFILTSLKIADGPVNYRGLFYNVKLLLLSCCRSYLVKACQVFISFSTRLVLLRILQQK